MSDEELIARLRKFPNGRYEHYDAADRIEALVKERDRYRAAFNTNCLVLRGTEERAERLEAEVEKLREVERAARKLEENLGVEGVNVGSLRVDLYRALAAAMKGADHE